MTRRLVVAGLVVDRGRVLAARRTYPPELAGRWEFPGGKVEPGESAQDALVRELAEELGLQVSVHDTLAGPRDGRWPITDDLDMQVYWCRARRPDPECRREHDMLAWLAPQWLGTPEWLPADVAIARAVATELPTRAGSSR